MEFCINDLGNNGHLANLSYTIIPKKWRRDGSLILDNWIKL